MNNMKDIKIYINENNKDWKLKIIEDIVYCACQDELDDDSIETYIDTDLKNDNDLNKLFKILFDMLNNLSIGSKDYLTKECKYTKQQIKYAKDLFNELSNKSDYKKLSPKIKSYIIKGCHDYWDTSW